MPGDFDDELKNAFMFQALVNSVMTNCSYYLNMMNLSELCKSLEDEDTSLVQSCCDNVANMTEDNQRPARRLEQCPDTSWQPYMKLICVPSLFIIGVFGNTLSFLVMCSDAYRRKSYGYYLRALAVFDNLTLLINLVNMLNDVNYDLEVKEQNMTHEYVGIMAGHNTVTCKVTEFLSHCIYLMCSWLVVCFTIDRFIAVCFPLLRVRYCTEKSAIYSIAAMFSAIMLTQAYHLYFVQRLDRLKNAHMPCHAPKELRLVYFGLNYFWFSFMLRFAVPFIVIAVCNGFIIYHIERMRRERRGLKERRKMHTASRAVCTLYAVCTVFVLTLLPCAIIAIIQFTDYVINQRVSRQLYCTLKVVFTPFEIVRLLNYSTNAILYGVTGRQFRQELMRLVWCCLGRGPWIEKRSPHSREPPAGTGRPGAQHEMLLLKNNAGCRNNTAAVLDTAANLSPAKRQSSRGSSRGSHGNNSRGSRGSRTYSH